MAREVVNFGELFSGSLAPDIRVALDDERVRAYVGGLPEISGTFTGTFSDDADLDELSGPVPDLMPIEIDTGDRPNPAALPMTGFTVRIGDDAWTMPVDHVDLLGGNRVRVWVRRPQPHRAE
jgi:hypothetical protein